MNQVHKYHQSGISPCRGRAHINGAMTLLECPSGVLFGVCVCVCVCVCGCMGVCAPVCVLFSHPVQVRGPACKAGQKPV